MKQFLLEVHWNVVGQRKARVEKKEFGTHSAREKWIEDNVSNPQIRDMIRKEKKPLL